MWKLLSIPSRKSGQKQPKKFSDFVEFPSRGNSPCETEETLLRPFLHPFSATVHMCLVLV